MENKINIVLVHGAWADGSSWHKVIPLLQAAGYNVSATQHPLTNLKDDVETVRRLAEAQDGTTLLVGHSYGGAVITEATNQCPGVAGLVYIAAFAPDAGENLGDLSQRVTPASGNASVHPDKYGMLWIDRNKFKDSFCQDVAEEEAAVMAATQKPIAIQCFTDKITNAGWKSLPCWYQVSEEDNMIASDLEKFMCERMHPKAMLSLPTGHAPMLSYPKAIAEFIIEASKHL